MIYIYMGAAIFYLLSIGSAGWYGLEQGKKLERADYLQQEKKRGEEINKGVAKIVRHIEQQNDAARAGLIVALGKREKDYEKINDQYNSIVAANQRLRVKTSAAAGCNKPVPGKDQGSSVPDREVEIELPATTERSLRAIARDAEYELANCNALRDIISPVIEVIGYAESIK
jgi:hypothetical protein